MQVRSTKKVYFTINHSSEYISEYAEHLQCKLVSVTQCQNIPNLYKRGMTRCDNANDA